MNLNKLKLTKGQNVFVVSESRYGMRHSDYGKLEEVNDGYNIIIAKKPFGNTVIPFGNERERIIKVYNSDGRVIYSLSTKTSWPELSLY